MGIPIIRSGRTFASIADECKYNTRIKLYPTSSPFSEFKPFSALSLSLCKPCKVSTVRHNTQNYTALIAPQNGKNDTSKTELRKIRGVNASQALQKILRPRLVVSRDAGDYTPAQVMSSDKPIFNPLGVKLVSSPPKEFKAYDVPTSCDEKKQEENKERAVRRARTKVYDYVRSNLDLSLFITLTFSPELVNRENYDEVIKRFNNWTSHLVQREGFKYIGVVERHKRSNGLHFHLVANNALGLVDSGTVKCKGKKKPIKVATADRLKIPASDRQTVYNIPSWGFGFSTAIEIDSDPQHIKVAQYISKYLTKDFEKIGGRYYYSGGKLSKPKYHYCNSDFKEHSGSDDSYTFEAGGTKFAIEYLNELARTSKGKS